MSTSIMARPRFPATWHGGSGVLLLVLVALALLFAVLSPYFLSWHNISNILLSVSVIGVLAAVSTLVVVGRGIDLSIGSLTALLGVVAGAMVEQYGAPWYLGGLAAVALGAACGTLNGAIVAYGRVNPIIATIGTLSVFRGAAYIVTDGQSILLQDPTLLFIGSGRVLGLPLAVWLLAAVVLAAQFLARSTAVGRSVYAVGANPRAALIAGLNVSAIRCGLMAASGASAGLAALLLIGQAGTALPSAAVGYELLVLTAILIGGTSLSGGEGSVLRTAIGVLIIGVLNNGMVLLAVPSFYQISAHGLLMLGAVLLDRLRASPGSLGD